jgi:hypothetical protein
MKVRQLQRFNEAPTDASNGIGGRRRSTFTGSKRPQVPPQAPAADSDILSPNEVTVNMGRQMGRKRMTITMDTLSSMGGGGSTGQSVGSNTMGERRASQFMPTGGAGHRLSLRSPLKLSDIAKDPTGQTFRSSKVFQPERYFKTRGMSVSFGGGEDRSSPGDGEVRTVRTNVRQSGLMVIFLALLLLLMTHDEKPCRTEMADNILSSMYMIRLLLNESIGSPRSENARWMFLYRWRNNKNILNEFSVERIL